MPHFRRRPQASTRGGQFRATSGQVLSAISLRKCGRVGGPLSRLGYSPNPGNHGKPTAAWGGGPKEGVPAE